MKMYDFDSLLEWVSCAIPMGSYLEDRAFVQKKLEEFGVPKAFAIRAGVIKLKHEVKAAMKKGAKAVDIGVLNERLQHIAKIPRPGLPKQRCNGKCRCGRPVA